MRDQDHPPFAPALIEAMRSVGYTFEAALADILDNSITAEATEIDIQFRSEKQSGYIAIIDNGLGMDQEKLIQAMRHGSTHPLEVRGHLDLGRYGLGLKTASLSQCKNLTVVSLQSNILSGACWDIEHIKLKKNWILQILEDVDFEKIPHIDKLKANGQGTIVIWRDFDKLLAGETNLEKVLKDNIDNAREHLSLIFHRYLAGESERPLNILINSRKLFSKDPFLLQNTSTQILPNDDFYIENKKITVKPFILPHIIKLSNEEINLAGGADTMRSQQGFYIYRNLRLIIWGTWFKLSGKDELNKLARVRVDIPNSLDHLWALDVKKSMAFPPELVRINLKRILGKILNKSVQTITYRGKARESVNSIPGWNVIQERNGEYRYVINRKNPQIAYISELLSDRSQALEGLLIILEQSFPFYSLYSKIAADNKIGFSDEIENELKRSLEDILDSLDKDSPTRQQIINSLHHLEPFDKYPELVKKIKIAKGLKC